MDANTVHTVARSLSILELQRLYNLIGKDLIKLNQNEKPKKKKPQLITDEEATNYLLKNHFKVKIK